MPGDGRKPAGRFLPAPRRAVAVVARTWATRSAGPARHRRPETTPPAHAAAGARCAPVVQRTPTRQPTLPGPRGLDRRTTMHSTSRTVRAVAVTALAMPVLLAGCTATKSGSDSGSGDSGTLKIGLITKTDSNPYFI